MLLAIDLAVTPNSADVVVRRKIAAGVTVKKLAAVVAPRKPSRAKWNRNAHDCAGFLTEMFG